MSESNRSLLAALDGKSAEIVAAALPEAREAGVVGLEHVSDEGLQVVLFIAVLKVLEHLEEGSPAGGGGIRDIFLSYAKNAMSYIDSQSSFTVGHTEGVVRYVGQLASLMGLPDAEIARFEYAAWIHNIGLINQFHRLATLPRPLSVDELQLARNHTVIGIEMIKPIDFLSDMVPIVRFHHHQYGDKSPGARSGDALPLGSRLIAVADAYQAMLEPRAYRNAMSRDDALNEIVKGASTQFDPKLIPHALHLS